MARYSMRRAVVLGVTAGLLTLNGVAGCGSSSDPPSDDDNTEAGEPGAGSGAVAGAGAVAGTAGSTGLGGSSGSGRGGTSGGSTRGGNAGRAGSSVGGSTNVGGGMPFCTEGVPCECDDDLVGVTVCEDEESSCDCPPAEECEVPEPEPCFEPCGGDPFGSWVLEETCITSKDDEAQCERLVSGTPVEEDLKLRILDGGEFERIGFENWEIETQVSLSCFAGITSVRECPRIRHASNPLIFANTWATTCEASACGVCACTSVHRGAEEFGSSTWRRDDENLYLGGAEATPYCVDGDELWIGSASAKSGVQVAYKFVKQSCAGTPVPCDERDEEECTQGTTCRLGLCRASTGSSTRCAMEETQQGCLIRENCVWEPDTCTGEAPEACEFTNCDRELGCEWGAPSQRCGGMALPCGERFPCEGTGCTPRVCNGETTPVSCAALNATDCAEAPGCVVGTGTPVCSGQTRCADQTDVDVCNQLSGCFSDAQCLGTPPTCASLTVETCGDVPGCRIEW